MQVFVPFTTVRASSGVGGWQQSFSIWIDPFYGARECWNIYALITFLIKIAARLLWAKLTQGELEIFTLQSCICTQLSLQFHKASWYFFKAHGQLAPEAYFWTLFGCFWTIFNPFWGPLKRLISLKDHLKNLWEHFGGSIEDNNPLLCVHLRIAFGL